MAWFCRNCGYKLAETKNEVQKYEKCPECGGTKVTRVGEGQPALKVGGKGKKVRNSRSLQSPTLQKGVTTIKDGLAKLFPVIKIKAEETVSIDEAVRYGFELFKGIIKYSILLSILLAIPVFLMAESNETNEYAPSFEWPTLTQGLIFLYLMMVYILYFSFVVGIVYKFCVDILGRSRKQRKDKPDEEA